MVSTAKKPELFTSVSQATTYADCPRKWWFTWPNKMPRVDRGYFSFGTIVHSVCERYLLADMQGRDRKTGKPVDLYPEGWATCEEGRGEYRHKVTITPNEQELVKKIITTAIEEGFLFREEEMLIEHKFDFVLLDEPDLDTVVRIVGFIDVMDSEGVQDHKTVGNWRYALSAKRLAKDVQVLVYAAVWIKMAEEAGLEVPDKIKVQHNQYGKDPANPKARKVIAHVTPRQAEGMLTWMRNISRNMIKTKKVDQWDKVEEADPDSGACNKYGGCEFLEICSGRETVKKYKERVLRVNARSLNSESKSQSKPEPKLKTRRSGTMGLFDKKMKDRAASAKGTKPETKAAPKETKPAAAAKEAEPNTTTAEAPPWANPECKACAGGGFNSKGQPCRICNSTAKRRGVPHSDEFVIEEVEGEFFWEPTGDVGESGSTATENGDKATKAKEETVDDPQQEAVPEKEAPAKGEEEDPKVAGRGRGRPKKGFTLYVGCSPTRGVSVAQNVTLEEILHDLRQQLADEQDGEESYWQMDAFKRRDAICAALPTVAEDFGTKHISVRSHGADIDPIVDVLRGLASIVVEA